MTLIADIFAQDAFSAVELTRAVNVVPNRYGRLNELGVFGDPIPVASTKIAVQFENGSLNLLPTRARGGPPSLGAPTRRNARVFNAFHIPHDDFVSGEDVPFLASGSGTVTQPMLETVQDVVNRKLLTMRNKHAITLEHLRMGALKGAVLDADGGTLINLFSEFGVTEKVINFAFGTASTDVAGVVRSVLSHIEDNLMGDTMTGVHALCSPEFFAALIGHAKVSTAYQFFQAAAGGNPLRDDVRRGFAFGGITFEEYRGSATQLNEDGTTTVRKFIPANEARFFPVGTTDTFATYFAPGDFIDVVGLPGEEVYARQAVDPEFQRWVKLHTQSNPLPLVKRPAVLVKGTMS